MNVTKCDPRFTINKPGNLGKASTMKEYFTSRKVFCYSSHEICMRALIENGLNMLDLMRWWCRLYDVVSMG